MFRQIKSKRYYRKQYKSNSKNKISKSALNNDLINIQYSKTGKKKELDDVFGTEILAADEAELKTIREYLERFLTPISITRYNKPNGYIATHTISRLKHDEDTASKQKIYCYTRYRNSI